MTAKSKSRERLPVGLSPEQEADWWDEHRDYWQDVDTPNEHIEPAKIRRTKPVNLRLPVDMIAALKREGAWRALPYQTLVRMWLKERLDAEALERRQQRSGRARARRSEGQRSHGVVTSESGDQQP
jgi:predicted DNA binding CopG/RHH family protein